MSLGVRAVVAEIDVLRSAIDKYLESGNCDLFNEQIYDALEALKRIHVTADILKKTKIGMRVNDLRKKCTDPAVLRIANLAKDLYVKWKKVYEDAQAGKSSEGSHNSPAPPAVESSVAVAPPKASSAIASEGGEVSSEPSPTQNPGEISISHFTDLGEGRRNVAKLLAESLAFDSKFQDLAISIGRAIELSVNSVHSFQSDRKAYQNKAKKLVFNVKQNTSLRMGLLDGEVIPSSLVNMRNEDLATQEQKYEREQALKADMMSRDLDWVKNNRDEILRANGYDPNMGGEFKCRNCKSTKTSHYAMQTRSSDEPMTIFVTCLGCGNRWRS